MNKKTYLYIKYASVAIDTSQLYKQVYINSINIALFVLPGHDILGLWWQRQVSGILDMDK